MRNTSARYSINSTDAWKTFRGFLLLILGFVITYVAGEYLKWDYTVIILDKVIDFTVPATGLITAILELGRRYIADNK